MRHPPTMVTTRAVLLGMVLTCPFLLTRAQQDKNPTNANNTVRLDINVTSFQEMQYPLLAYHARIEGIIPVQVKLDDKGRVISSAAVSGPGILAAPSEENARKWTFIPNAGKSAIIIYRYKILSGTCNEESQLFILQKPNVATVLACPPLVNPSAANK